MSRPLHIVVVYPDLLGTYGDGGNGVVLWRRASWRGGDAVVSAAPSDQPLPRADIYCIGGGEDAPQAEAARALIDDGTLAAAAADGAVVLAVCAGYQIVGRSFPGSDGSVLEGVGLLDVTTTKGTGTRAVGELLASPVDGAGHLPLLTGFENHAGLTDLGPGVAPLARVLSGTGNGDRTEGALTERVVGTYLHGPVLARNPALADHLLARTGRMEAPLAALDDHEAAALRAERIGAARHARSAPAVAALTRAAQRVVSFSIRSSVLAMLWRVCSGTGPRRNRARCLSWEMSQDSVTLVPPSVGSRT